MTDGAKCQVCEERGEPLLVHGSMMFRRCPTCGFVFMDPMPDAARLGDLYTDAYSGATKGYFKKTDSKMRRCRRRAKWLSRRASGKRFLDVGCNGGFMTEAMRERGFQAHGIDPDSVSIAWAREHYPDNRFHVATAEGFDPGKQRFDVVYCSDVIEHAPDVNRFVSSIAALMTPGAVLFLTTPDIGHWRRPRDITKWNAFAPTESLPLFQPSEPEVPAFQAWIPDCPSPPGFQAGNQGAR